MKRILWPSVITVFFLLQANDRIMSATSAAALNFFLFCVIIFYSAYRVFNNKHAYSLNLFFWIFNLVFMGYVSAFQYMAQKYPWVRTIDDTIVTQTNTYIILAMVVYDMIYSFYKVSPPKFERRDGFTINYSKFNFYFLGFGLFCICWVISVAIGGIHFTRASTVADQTETIQDKALVVGISLRSATLFFTVLCTHLLKEKKIPMWFGAIVLIMGFLLCIPTSVSRNYVGIFYLGLLFNYFRVFKKAYIRAIPIAFIFIMNVVFPILTYARYDFFSFDYVVKNFSDMTANAFLSGDFDAHSMFCEVVRYTQEHDVTYGRQIMGVLFFFVPRSLWPDKPVGSGYFIGEQFRYDFLNISCPYMAEGFINFGLIGMIFFMAVLAIMFKTLDSFYWARVKAHALNNYWIIIYPSLTGAFFFIFRGDLLSSFAYTFGLLVVSFLFHKMLSFRVSSKI
jgi:oligosaccharide repeat unit polymerase